MTTAKRAAWHQVQLAGNKHEIPKICPGCGEPGVKAVIVASRTAVQDFWYCDQCSQSVEESYRVDAWLAKATGRIFWVVFAVLGIPCLVGFVLACIAANIRVYGAAFVILLPAIGVSYAVSLIVKHVARARARSRVPLGSQQVTWGPNARKGILPDGCAVYVAQRVEWLRSLVLANLECADEETKARFRAAAGGSSCRNLTGRINLAWRVCLALSAGVLGGVIGFVGALLVARNEPGGLASNLTLDAVFFVPGGGVLGFFAGAWLGTICLPRVRRK